MNVYKTITDETFRETIVHGKEDYPLAYYPENIWEFDFHRIDWHWHNELEILYVADGKIFCLVGADKIELREGYAIFINSSVLHRYEAQGSTFTPNIVFAPTLMAAEDTLVFRKFIRPVICSSVMYQVFDPKISWQQNILQILQQIFVLQRRDEKNELGTIQMVLQMWEILFQNINLGAGDTGHRRLSHQQAKLQIMMQYIQEHYMEEITLERIARAASISKSGALHIFQSGIHISPVAYLIQYRLKKAAEQLQTTQKTVSAIALDTGFSSPEYFCRQFKQHYYMSAMEYRRKTT